MPSAAEPPREPRPRQTRPRTLAEVCERLSIDRPRRVDPGLLVCGVTHDSRTVRPGDLYAALPGARVHGADYAAQAAAAGARAVLTDQTGARAAAACGLPVLTIEDPRGLLGALAAWIYGDPAASLLTIGITGTNGKTTTAYLVDAGLRRAGRHTGLIGTVETRMGAARLPSVRTTPEATELQAVLAVMTEQGVEAVTMEVSSHALAQGRVDGLVYDVAVFSNLSQDHLDFHADLEDYFAAKASLFTPHRARRAVVNVDDPYGARLAARAPIPLTTVSAAGRADADWRAEHVQLGSAGSTFDLVGPRGQRVAAAVGLPGRFNVDNGALAVVAVTTAGQPLDAAAAGVAACAGVPGRMERVDAGQDFLAVVDYAHTPEAVRTALDALRPAVTGRLIAVLGCGGDRDRAKRPLMGAAAARGADLVVFTDDNPRSEDSEVILAAMVEGAVEGARRAGRGVASEFVHVIPDRRKAIAYAVAAAGPRDAVAVLGKGHEEGQEIAGVVHPFDDRAVLREHLAAAAR